MIDFLEDELLASETARTQGRRLSQGYASGASILPQHDELLAALREETPAERERKRKRGEHVRQLKQQRRRARESVQRVMETQARELDQNMEGTRILESRASR